MFTALDTASLGARRERQGQPRPGRAFTLVELMVVVMILGILGMLGLSSMGKRKTTAGAQGLAREIYALANQARMTAAATETQVLMSLRWPGETALANGQTPAATLQMAPAIGNGVYAVNQFGPVISQVFATQAAQIMGVDAGPFMNTVALMANRNTTVNLIFYPNGTAQIPGQGTTGATIYIADATLLTRQRVLVYGRTGFAKVLDR